MRKFLPAFFALAIALVFGFGLSAKAGGPITVPNVAGSLITTGSSASDVRTMLDVPLGTTRGSVAYRGASGWTALVPVSSGFVLTDQGIGADPIFAAAATTSIAGVNAVPASTNLAAYWKLDTNSSGYADSSGNGRTLTVTGTVNTTAGKFSNAADFTAGNSANHLDMASNDTGMDFGGSDWTVSFWFKETGNDASEQDYIYKFTSSTSGWRFYRSAAGDLGCQLIGVTFTNGASTTFESNSALFTGAGVTGGTLGSLSTRASGWHHVAWRRLGDQVSVFLDGTLFAWKFITGSVTASTHAVRIGASDSPSNPVTGDMDDIAIWIGRGLSNFEIQYMSQQGPNGIAGHTAQ